MLLIITHNTMILLCLCRFSTEQGLYGVYAATEAKVEYEQAESIISQANVSA
jgi:hypothetical protein